MKCKNCGKEIREDFLYCPYCGFPISEDDPEYLVRRSLDFRKRWKIKDALEHCGKAMKFLEDPCVGELAYLVGDLELSIESYKKSIELLPDFPDTIYAMGISYFRMGRIKRAVEYFEKCLEKNPEFSMAYYWLGHSYYHTGRIDKAVDNFEKLLEYSPQSKIAHYHLGIVYHSKGDDEKALEHFKKLEETGAEYASLFFHMGNALFRLHRIPEAIEYLKRAVELNPKEERAKTLLSRIAEPPAL